VLPGTSLELSYFLFQLPTGVLADVVSRRLCVLGRLLILRLGLVIDGLSAAFDELALPPEAGEADHSERPIAGVHMRATRLGLAGTVAGSLLSCVIAPGGLNLPLLTGGSLICLLAPRRW
jgi:MFS transporter, DHA3 family, tetracycline resistance protein